MLAAVAACVSPTAINRRELCIGADAAPVRIVETAGGVAIDISVLIYNVEGLPWPARRGRGRYLEKIGAELRRLREAGAAPDIIMLQEVFSPRAVKILSRSGYPNIAAGPDAKARRRLSSAAIPDAYVEARRLLRGEKGPILLDSGLYILSSFPIISVEREPFSRHACAGFDCLSNKGVLLARIAIPGAPTPIEVFTTHMNAQRASRVDIERTHAAHVFQTDESAILLNWARDSRYPLIFGGDFNMRNAQIRLDHFSYRKPYAIVRHFCTIVVDDCDVRMSWDGDEPWLDTQDLQGFEPGEFVDIRPIRAEAMFDRPENGGKLSDHDGYLVTYRLSWPAGLASQPIRDAGGRICVDETGAWTSRAPD